MHVHPNALRLHEGDASTSASTSTAAASPAFNCDTIGASEARPRAPAQAHPTGRLLLPRLFSPRAHIRATLSDPPHLIRLCAWLLLLFWGEVEIRRVEGVASTCSCPTYPCCRIQESVPTLPPRRPEHLALKICIQFVHTTNNLRTYGPVPFPCPACARRGPLRQNFQVERRVNEGSPIFEDSREASTLKGLCKLKLSDWSISSKASQMCEDP